MEKYVELTGPVTVSLVFNVNETETVIPEFFPERPKGRINAHRLRAPAGPFARQRQPRLRELDYWSSWMASSLPSFSCGTSTRRRAGA